MTVSVKDHMKKSLVPGVMPEVNFPVYSMALETMKANPVTEPPKRNRRTPCESSRLAASTARATNHELVSRIRVSMPPNVKFRACLDDSKIAARGYLSCMKEPNSRQKMTR